MYDSSRWCLSDSNDMPSFVSKSVVVFCLQMSNFDDVQNGKKNSYFSCKDLTTSRTDDMLRVISSTTSQNSRWLRSSFSIVDDGAAQENSKNDIKISSARWCSRSSQFPRDRSGYNFTSQCLAIDYTK